MLAAMKRIALLVPFVFTACSGGPSQQEASRLFGAAGAAMASAQSSAVSTGGGHALVAPAQMSLDYTGPCALGGTAGVTGTYDDSSGSGSDAAFDMTIAFAACKGVGGTLDGSVHWTSTQSSTGFSATMNGNLDWTDGNDSASCGIDVQLAVTSTSVSYSGTVCGYDVKTDLHM